MEESTRRIMAMAETIAQIGKGQEPSEFSAALVWTYAHHAADSCQDVPSLCEILKAGAATVFELAIARLQEITPGRES